MSARRTAVERAEPARRLFVAVDPPPEAVMHLGAVVDGLRVSRANAPGRSTRLAARDRWHVTLAFLGEVPVSWIERAVGALAAVGGEAGSATAAGAARLGGPSDPLRVCFAGGGTFGRGRSTVLWVGLGGDVIALRRLADAVRRQLRRARLPFDAKSFKPHLTISRPGARVERDLIAADVAELRSYVGPLWIVGAVHLYASDVMSTPTGPRPRYTRLASTPLG